MKRVSAGIKSPIVGGSEGERASERKRDRERERRGGERKGRKRESENRAVGAAIYGISSSFHNVIL